MHSSSSVWQRFHTQHVRDLAWVLASPPLLQPVRSRTASGRPVRWLSAEWCNTALSVSLDWLHALDRNPAPLQQALVDRDGRLGHYFENLLAFWLAWDKNPLYRLIRHGIAICSQHRTLGELDFLVEDKRSGKLQHWEVAVKFYLGTRPHGDYRHWLGPALHDRLDLKVTRLLSHQLDLSATNEGAGLLRHLGLTEPEPVCLLKGRLFYPPDADIHTWAPAAASPGHLCGWWMPPEDFLCRYQDDSAINWIKLPRDHWLTAIDSCVRIGDAERALPFIEQLEHSFDNRAIAVIGLDDRHNEVTRGFITPPEWPQDTP
jgi:hypothetical protein